MKKGFIGFLLMAFCMPFVMNAQFKAPVAVVYDTIDTCNSYTWVNGDGHTYTTNSTGYHIYKDILNNDSLLVVRTFIIRHSSQSEVWDSTCGKYRWALNGKVYTAPGDFKDTIKNMAGCDSIITLHLSLKNPDTVYTDIVQCEPYTWSVDSVTYTGDTIVFAPNPVIGADSCQGVLGLRYKRLTDGPVITVNTCETSYTWPVNGITYNTGSDTVSYRKPNSGAGCDTVFTLIYNIGISQYKLEDTAVTAYRFFVWNNDTIKADSARIDTVLVQVSPSLLSCDTVKSYKVTIIPVFTIDTSFCGGSRGYYWPSFVEGQMKIWLKKSGDTTYMCKDADQKDSCLMEFHYTDLASDTTWLPAVSACDKYVWDANGNTYRESKDSIVCRLTNKYGCDSVVILTKLVINPLPTVYIEGNLWIKPGNSTKLFATGDSNIVAYQWSTGETTDTIVVAPSQNTDYTLTATNSNNCSRTATATVVVSESINQAGTASVKVYPNPASTKVTIEGDNLANVKLYNMLGQLIITKDATSGKVVIPVNDYNNGSYILRAESNDGKTTIRSVVIKK